MLATDRLLPLLTSLDARQWAAWIIGSQQCDLFVNGLERLRMADGEVSHRYGAMESNGQLDLRFGGVLIMMSATTLPAPLYVTKLGSAVVGDSLDLLEHLPEASVDLVMTSPPFALQRQKDYGNKPQEEYVDWLTQFAREVHRILKDTGSFVLDLGGAYEKGRPVRSLYNYRVVIRFCDELGFRLAEEFFWYNPAKLPSPIEWVDKRKSGPRMGQHGLVVQQDGQSKGQRQKRFWRHTLSDEAAAQGQGGLLYGEEAAILVTISAELHRQWQSHPVEPAEDSQHRKQLPISRRSRPSASNPIRPFLPLRTAVILHQVSRQPGDLVLDIFAGSCTTGEAAQSLGRHWLGFELDHPYLATSAFRFADDLKPADLGLLYKQLLANSRAKLN